MRILQLCKKFPYPLKDGEAIAITNLTKGFAAEGHEVDVLAINTHKHHFDPARLPDELQATADYSAVTVDTDVRISDALINLFSNRSYHITRFIAEAFDQKLQELLRNKSYDLIQLEGLYLTPYVPTIRQLTNAPVVLRAHNIEYEIWQRIVQNEGNFLKRGYLAMLTKRLQAYEISAINEYDAIVPITERDKQRFTNLGCNLPMYVTPAGIDLTSYQHDKVQTEFPSVFFLGGLDWLPNQEGLRWFLANVWPKLLQEFPGLPFYIAGRNQPKWMRNLQAPNVYVVGEVDDALAFMRSKAVMVVPLLSGSGMRIKIAEGMAMGRAVVSTSIGTEGIPAHDNEHICIADTAELFAGKIAQCLRNPSFYDQLGQNGRTFVEENFEYKTLAKKLLSFYKEEFFK